MSTHSDNNGNVTTSINHKTSGSVTVVNLNSPTIESQITANNSLQAQTKHHPPVIYSTDVVNTTGILTSSINNSANHYYSNNYNNISAALFNKDTTSSSTQHSSMIIGTVVSVAPIMMHTSTTGVSRVSHQDIIKKSSRNKQSRSSPSSPKDHHRKLILTGNIKIRK